MTTSLMFAGGAAAAGKGPKNRIVNGASNRSSPRICGLDSFVALLSILILAVLASERDGQVRVPSTRCVAKTLTMGPDRRLPALSDARGGPRQVLGDEVKENSAAWRTISRKYSDKPNLQSNAISRPESRQEFLHV